ncbi:hypothetical protein C8F01DRAFT_1376218 [Mycena amicta]|nr:hypothetical protein C8F01DRAFT_1376218 [Mycena amicta]
MSSTRYNPYYHRRSTHKSNPHATNRDLEMYLPREMHLHHIDHRRLNRIEEELVSFDHSAEDGIRQYKVVAWPQYAFTSTMRPLAPSGFNKSKLQFFCAHRNTVDQPYAPLTFTKRNVQGRQVYLYEAKDHKCSLPMLIPERHTRRPALLQNEHQIVEWSSTQDLSSPPRWSSLPPSSSLPSSSPPLSSSSAMFSSSQASQSSETTSPGDNILTDMREHALVHPSPRLGPPSPKKGTRPQPQHFSGSRVVCYFSPTVADARKMNDMEVANEAIDYFLERNGNNCPENHPAFNPDLPPRVLHVYHSEIYPHANQRSLAHNNSNTPCGRLVDDLNSPLGALFASFDAARRSSQTCNGCNLQFSPDGYTAHVVDGHCTNHPDLTEVGNIDLPSADTYRLRTFRDGKLPSSTAVERSPICTAFYEWNSRLGVPQDVWWTIVTAVILCPDCDLVRTFPAHQAHLDRLGGCADPGQALTILRGDGAD